MNAISSTHKQKLPANVLVLGLGESGLAMALWFLHHGASVRIIDSRAAPPMLSELLHAHPLVYFDSLPLDATVPTAIFNNIDLVALSPGIAIDAPIVKQLRSAGITVLGEIEIFAQNFQNSATLPKAKMNIPASLKPTRHNPWVIGITGTNGKTTTTTLVAHLCKEIGIDVVAAGNISPSALAVLHERTVQKNLPQCWVLELSSFQLETTESLALTAATVLNISEDHLDRHHLPQQYSHIKQRIFAHCPLQVLNRQDPQVMKMRQDNFAQISFGLDQPPSAVDFGIDTHQGAPWIVRGTTPLIALADIPMHGNHNAANSMAALALLTGCGADLKKLLPGLRNFSGLAHRVTPVVISKGGKDSNSSSDTGVTWYDDSKGTNVGATIAAIQSLARPPKRAFHRLIILLGGMGKGQNFSLLAPVMEHVHFAICYGQDKAIIARAIQNHGAEIAITDTLYSAVALADQHAQIGDRILLSPACASFDQFKNYEDRAHSFIEAIQKIATNVVLLNDEARQSTKFASAASIAATATTPTTMAKNATSAAGTNHFLRRNEPMGES